MSGRARHLLFAAIAGMSCAMVSAAGLQAGTPVPAPRAADARLAQHMDSLAGRPLLINFWASWCEPCREEMPALARLASRGVVVITVVVADRDADAVRFMREAAPSLPLIYDREQRTSRAWGARMLPYSVVLDRNHRIVARAQGVVDWDDAAVVEQLRALMN